MTGLPSMMWMSDIAANGPIPSSRPARTLTTAWLTRVMSGNGPERAMTWPMASGSVIGPTGGSLFGVAWPPSATAGCEADMRAPFVGAMDGVDVWPCGPDDGAREAHASGRDGLAAHGSMTSRSG